MHLKRYSPGNTIAEYGLVAGLVLGVCLVALANLGTNVDGQFGELKDSLVKKPALTALPSSGDNGMGGIPGEDGLTDLEGLPAGTIPNSVYQALGRDKIEEITRTAGANGTTEYLAQILEQYAKQLSQSKELTEEQANWLSRLAGEGYKLASAEKMLEEAAFQKTATVQYQGRTYSREEFTDMFGFNRFHGVVGSANSMDTTKAMPLTVPFISIYQEAKERGALDDPAVAKVVTNLSTQITVMSDLVKWNTEEAAKTGRTTDDYKNRLRMGLVTAFHQINLPDLGEQPQTGSEFTNERSCDIRKQGQVGCSPNNSR